jgi:UDP-glucose 4-epimerase
MMSKNIVVIGATGSTGIYLTDYLSGLGYRIWATGHKKRSNEYYQNKGINYISFDISKAMEFDKLPTEEIDCVVLLAGVMPARMKGYDPYKYIDINITGVLNTLEYCRKNLIKKIIFTQSHSDVAGHWNTGEYIKDDASRILNLKGDHAVYIISKCAAVDLIEHYHQEFGIQNVIFRLPTIYCYMPNATFYANGEKKEIAYLSFINKAIKGEPIEIWGNPEISKDIVYIKDFIQMIERAICSEHAQGMYNVGTGIPTTLENQVKGVIDVFSDSKNRSEIIYRPEKASQTSYLYDIRKAQEDLGYIVQYPYIKMLKDMKEEMNNPILGEILSSVVNE